MARKASPEPDFDRDLADLPPELRWREWKARVEAVLFAAAKPITRDILARVVGRDCALELLLDDLREDLRGRPIDLVRAGESFALHTHPAFGPTVRVAFDIPIDAKQLTKLEAGVLMAVAMFQPVTRGDISDMFGREISRDLIAGLREEGLIAAGPRSPKIGAPYAYVTTKKFLFEFGLESLRDLPDIEALKDAGLMRADVNLALETGSRRRRLDPTICRGWRFREIASRSSATLPRLVLRGRIPSPAPIFLCSDRTRRLQSVPSHRAPAPRISGSGVRISSGAPKPPPHRIRLRTLAKSDRASRSDWRAFLKATKGPDRRGDLTRR